MWYNQQMSEYASDEIRVHKAPKGWQDLIGPTLFVDYYSTETDSEVRLGIIYSDGRFSPPILKELIKRKEKLGAVTTPLNIFLLGLAKIPAGGIPKHLIRK